MPRALLAAAAAASLLAFAAGSAAARDLPSGGVTANEVAAWLKGQGYAGTVKPDDTTPGDFIVSSVVDGISYDIYFYSCDGTGAGGRRCTSLQYAAGWTAPTKLTADMANAWDRDKRFVRAYMDKKGDAWGEYDVDISPGGTYEQLDQSFVRWRQTINDFKTYIGQ